MNASPPLTLLDYAGWDIWISLGILALALLYVYTIGKDFAVTIVLALYMAIATIMFTPFISELAIAGLNEPLLRVIMLLALTAFFCYLMITNGYFEPVVVPSGWESAVFAVIFTGMFVSFSIGFLPQEALDQLSPQIQALFLDQPFSNVWLILPAATLLFLKGEA